MLLSRNRLVSVIIPTYNRSETILRSINSVLCQTYPYFELIIVDDGSTDNTREIVDAIDDSRIRYYYQENQGACTARNKGILVSNGEYIAFQDSDDVWHPDKLEKQMAVIEEYDADILFCRRIAINGKQIGTVYPDIKRSGFISREDMIPNISTQCLIMKKEVTDDYSFDPQMPRLQDLDYILRATQKYSLYGLTDILVDYWYSDDAISRSDEKLLMALEILQQKWPELKSEMPVVNKEIMSLWEARGNYDCINQ